MMSKKYDYKKWSSIKGKLIQIYPTLTKADLIWRHGSEDDLFDMIASKLGKSTKELQEELDNL